MQVPGLGIAKAAFVLQCLGVETACLDTHNLQRLGLEGDCLQVPWHPLCGDRPRQNPHLYRRLRCRHVVGGLVG